MPDETIRKRVLDAIGSGLLPARLPSKTWGGFGAGSLCSLCGKSITADQLETEFEDAEQRGRTYRLHLQCQAAWETVLADQSRSLDARLQLASDERYSAAGEQHSGTRYR